MIYCFDIDGTICRTEGTDYENAEPDHDVIRRIRSLVRDGHKVCFYTARGSGTGTDWSYLTRKQLRRWGLGDCEVTFGKPPADVYVDDRAVSVGDWKDAGEIDFLHAKRAAGSPTMRSS